MMMQVRSLASLSGSRILHWYGSGVGRASSGSDLTPHLGTSIGCTCSPRRKKKRERDREKETEKGRKEGRKVGRKEKDVSYREGGALWRASVHISRYKISLDLRSCGRDIHFYVTLRFF